MREVLLFALFVILLAGAIQLATWTLGLDFNLLSRGGGRPVLILLALAAAMWRLSSAQRSAAEAGLAFGEHWPKHLGIGALVAAIAAAIAVAIVLVRAEAVAEIAPLEAARKLAEASFVAALTAGVWAILFPGWMAGALRHGFSRSTSIAIAALLGGLAAAIVTAAEHGLSAGVAVGVGIALATAGGCALRFASGDIAGAWGACAGALAIERTARKIDLTDAVPADRLAGAWEAWIIIALILGASALLMRRRDPARDLEAPSGEMSETMRRLIPFAHMGLLAPVDVWIAQLTRARWRVDPIYLPRLAATLATSTLNVALTLPERLVAPLLPFGRRAGPPIFVVGAHRSGTTHLQNLLALDTSLVAARTRHVINPHGFLTTGWILAPILAAFSPWKRPMDSVKFGLNTPNEEEYALANMSGLSPDWAIRLPRARDRYERFMLEEGFTPEERRRWARLYRIFVRKLTLFSRRAPLMKNPYNTGRVGMLADVFPAARFVHIHRDPYAVHRSNLHLAATAHPLFQMQEEPEGAGYTDRFLDHYRAMEERYYQDAGRLPPARAVDVRFEDLESDPIREIERVYAALGLEMTERYAARLRAYVEEIAGYRKNRLRGVDPRTRQAVRTVLGPLFERWGRDPETGAPLSSSQAGEGVARRSRSSNSASA